MSRWPGETNCNRIGRATKELRAYAQHPNVPASLEVAMLKHIDAIEREAEKLVRDNALPAPAARSRA